MRINVTQIATNDKTIIIAIVRGIPYKRTFSDELAANAFLEILSDKDDAKEEDFQAVMKMIKDTTNEEFLAISTERERALAKVESFHKLHEFGIIEEDGSFYMAGGPKISMPERLVEEFALRISRKESVEYLMNFWKLCLLNPDPQARQDLFKFLKDGKIEITPAGLFVSYRSVEETDKVASVGKQIQEEASSTTEKSLDVLEEFVIEQYDYLRSRKKGTGSQRVWAVIYKDKSREYVRKKEGQLYLKDDAAADFNVEVDTILNLQDMGNLKTLYEGYTNPEVKEELAKVIKPESAPRFEKIYTDAHSKSMEIRMLQEVRMPREDCDNNHNKDCSSGLHVGTEAFVTKNSYFGKVGIKVLINPRNVVSVPYVANTKMRVCAYFPFEFIEWAENGHPKVSDSNTFDYAYIDYDMAQMEQQLLDLTIEELERQIILPKGMSIGHLGKLVRDIANDITRKRVIRI